MAIYIGRSEGEAIALHLLDRRAPRPMTYTLMASLLEAAGAELEQVRIEALKKDIFYAVARLRSDDAVREVDARPSDAIALALRTGSPIYAAEEVLERTGIDIPQGVGEAPQPGRGIEGITQEWEHRREEWERKRQAVESRPRPTKEEVAQKREKAQQELIDLVFGGET